LLDVFEPILHKYPMLETKTSHRWLAPFIEYGPLAIFFVSYYSAGLFFATAAIIIATIIALLVSIVVERRIPMMPLITAGIIGVFGGLTLWLNDETFIKMKPTIIQLIFGLVLIGGLLFNRLFFKSLMGSVWKMTDKGWRIMTLRFSMFFFLSAALNEIIWRTQSTDFWVNFKVFGLMGLTLVFVLAQLPLLQRFSVQDKDKGDAN